uniref:Tctex1 domain-containing protein 2 n=1 Tax=Panagrellus redivivus TaxID=6233 RepID=A0A7E4VMM6_PANRE
MLPVLRSIVENKDKFRPTVGKKILEKCASELLTAQKYADANVNELSRVLAENVRKEFIDLQLPRNKYVVEVILGEQRGQGARIHSGCSWDVDTDSQVSHFYQNDSLFCLIVVFVVFTYTT